MSGGGGSSVRGCLMEGLRNLLSRPWLLVLEIGVLAGVALVAGGEAGRSYHSAINEDRQLDARGRSLVVVDGVIVEPNGWCSALVQSPSIGQAGGYGALEEVELLGGTSSAQLIAAEPGALSAFAPALARLSGAEMLVGSVLVDEVGPRVAVQLLGSSSPTVIRRWVPPPAGEEFSRAAIRLATALDALDTCVVRLSGQPNEAVRSELAAVLSAAAAPQEPKVRWFASDDLRSRWPLDEWSTRPAADLWLIAGLSIGGALGLVVAVLTNREVAAARLAGGRPGHLLVGLLAQRLPAVGMSASVALVASQLSPHGTGHVVGVTSLATSVLTFASTCVVAGLGVVASRPWARLRRGG